MNKQGEIFKGRYAEFYDSIYESHKDYAKECDFIELLIKKFSKKKVVSILDIGCGTGNHSLILAERGYDVTGIDFSKDMVSIAGEKAKEKGLSANFSVQKMQDFEFDKKFDVVICMFAAFDYIIEHKDIVDTLNQVRKHMDKESFFIFDFWNGNEVLFNYSPITVKSIKKDDKEIIRTANVSLNKMKNAAELDLNYLIIYPDKPAEKFKESHFMRYFFFNEIINYLEDNGLELIKFVPLLDFDGDIHSSWSITAIAKLKG